MTIFSKKDGRFEWWRIGIIYAAIVLVMIFYIFRLFSLQVLNPEDYLVASEDNRTEEISIQTQRGTILDRNGYVLAKNIPSYHVVITPAYLPADEGAIQQVYRELSQLISVPVNKGETDDETARLFKPCETDIGITQIVYIGDTNAPYDPVRIACDVNNDIAMIVKEKDWPGVSIEIEPVRDYVTGWYTSEIIGFLGPIPAALEEAYIEEGLVPNRDKVGYAGIEYTMQEDLGGTNGKRVVEVDSAGQVLRDLQPPIPAQAGNNVVLTIDTRLQMAAKQALIGEMNGWNAYLNDTRMTNGVVIAMNPKTGEVLAMVSQPTYENNRMARFIPAYYYEQLTSDPNRPLFNHAISAELPPGSVYKMAAAVGFINENVVTPEYLVEDLGKITVLQKFSPNDPGIPKDYVCYDDNGHGMVDYLHAIALSCDVYFYKVSGGYQNEVKEGLGVWKMAQYARALGYGEITGIELPGEASGLVPDPDWKRVNLSENWATGDTYIASMGQGYVLATPLQVLVSFATLANDGKRMRPTLIYEVRDSEGNVIKPFEPDMTADITQDPLIEIYDANLFATGEKKTVAPYVIELAKRGMRMVVEPGGTGENTFAGFEIPSAGKTGTAEYCDDVAQSKNLCQPGSWPTHSWYAGYAPFDDPEIVVVGFVYNGGEGASVAGPIVRKTLEAYFELKALDEEVPQS